MNIERLIEDLKHDEGLRLKPYRCTAGKLTIGVGRNLDDVGIFEAEADYLLGNDIASVAADLDRALPWWRELSDARQRALANMAFNLGLSRLLGFKNMLVALHGGEFDRAADAALSSAWASQVGDRSKRIAAMFREG
jgi:lysozyme